MCIPVSSPDNIGGSDIGERAPCPLKNVSIRTTMHMDSDVLDSYVDKTCISPLVPLYFQFFEKCKE